MGERISRCVTDVFCAYVGETVRVLSGGGHPRRHTRNEAVRGLRTGIRRVGGRERVCTRGRMVWWQIVERDADGRHTRPGRRRLREMKVECRRRYRLGATRRTSRQKRRKERRVNARDI